MSSSGDLSRVEVSKLKVLQIQCLTDGSGALYILGSILGASCFR